MELTDLKIPFGRLPNGEMVGAADQGVANGTDCGCVCPQCGSRLVAKSQGQRLRAHFAHAMPEEEALPCVGSGETSIHLMAKQIIAGAFTLRLPDFIAVFPPLPPRKLYELEGDLWHRIRGARLEVRLEGFRPDILVTLGGAVEKGRGEVIAKDGDLVAVEVAVTHPCEDEKVQRLRDDGLIAYEIDLSASNYSADQNAFREAIKIAPKKWLFHPAIDRATEQMRHEVAIRSTEQRQLNEGASSPYAEAMAHIERVAPAERDEFQLSGLRRYDAFAWKRYDYNDDRQRAMMEELLRQPVRRGAV